MVGLDATEAHGSEDRMKNLVPDSVGLFESIEQLADLANIFWSAHLKSFRLLHVDLFLQYAIEIGGIKDVYRVKVKVLQCCDGQNGVNGGVANSGSRGLLEIKTRTLRITFCDHPALAAIRQCCS
jgi:hypothetical protein